MFYERFELHTYFVYELVYHNFMFGQIVKRVRIYKKKRKDDSMKKKYLYSAGAAGVIGATVAGYFLKNKDKRDNVKRKVKNYQNSIRSTLEEAGVPDQSEDKGLEQLENAKMVSEGSQFGVQYYNENKEANTSEYQQ
ncbi:hypothetical protein [Virgibacillus sp.]|nr:hypothetical protein [Virgibacillus sp.]